MVWCILTQSTLSYLKAGLNINAKFAKLYQKNFANFAYSLRSLRLKFNQYLTAIQKFQDQNIALMPLRGRKYRPLYIHNLPNVYR
ncbi:hypothetical protein D3C87_1050160 [compost metagenome]